MLNEDTKRKLIEMRMDTIASEFTAQLDNPEYGKLSFEERFGIW